MIFLALLVLGVLMNIFWPWIPAFIEIIVSLFTWNPTVFCFPQEAALGLCQQNPGMIILHEAFLNILIPFYIVALMLNALYFVFMAGSPRGRARSKLMFQKLILSMVLVTFSPILFQAILDVGAMLTYFVYDHVIDLDQLIADQQAYFDESPGVFYLPPVLILTVVLAFTFLLLLWRYFVLFFFGAAFPFIIFLYFFEFTKGTGRTYLRKIIKWAFLPVLQVLLLGFALQASTTFQNIEFLGVDPGLDAAIASFILNSIALIALYAVTTAGALLVLIAPLIMAQLLNTVSEMMMTYGYAKGDERWLTLGGAIRGSQAGIVSAIGYRAMQNAQQAYEDSISHGHTSMMHGHYGPPRGGTDAQTGGLSDGGGTFTNTLLQKPTARSQSVTGGVEQADSYTTERQRTTTTLPDERQRRDDTDTVNVLARNRHTTQQEAETLLNRRQSGRGGTAVSAKREQWRVGKQERPGRRGQQPVTRKDVPGSEVAPKDRDILKRDAFVIGRPTQPSAPSDSSEQSLSPGPSAPTIAEYNQSLAESPPSSPPKAGGNSLLQRTRSQAKLKKDQATRTKTKKTLQTPRSREQAQLQALRQAGEQDKELTTRKREAETKGNAEVDEAEKKALDEHRRKTSGEDDEKKRKEGEQQSEKEKEEARKKNQ